MLLMTKPSDSHNKTWAGFSKSFFRNRQQQQGSFISPGICVEQTRTDPEQTSTQEVLSSGTPNCLHLPLQKVWAHIISFSVSYFSFLPSALITFNPFCFWEPSRLDPLLSPLPSHDSDSETREHHKAAALVRSGVAALCSHRLLHCNLSFSLILHSHGQVGGHCLIPDDKCDWLNKLKRREFG